VPSQKKARTEPAEPAASDQVDLSDQAARSDLTEPVEQPAGRRVVVAEDEALIRLDIIEILREAGYQVVGEAPDGEQAVQLAEQHRPDLVVMDVKMPVLDGISAAERIAKARIAPVVLLTAFSQRELVERARDAGAMAYVVKPFSAADLLPALEIALSRHQEIAALESEVADLAERFETRKLVDRAKGLLQTKFGMNEPEAFRWVQKTSMDKRLTMREVAAAIVNSTTPAEGSAALRAGQQSETRPATDPKQSAPADPA
jgi:AmiR/NasT family two-component response regulator